MNGSIQITALVREKATIPYSEFPKLLNAHLARNKNTPALEAKGYALRTSRTIKWAELEAFIKEVCGWGDYSGISGRVIKNNSQSLIMNSVRDAISKLGSTPPDLIGALNSMLQIEELGVSFASKHLRFLLPEHCPVLDSILSYRLFYELSPDGYKSFAAACAGIADEINAATVACPFPGQVKWRPTTSRQRSTHG